MLCFLPPHSLQRTGWSHLQRRLAGVSTQQSFSYLSKATISTKRQVKTFWLQYGPGKAGCSLCYREQLSSGTVLQVVWKSSLYHGEGLDPPRSSWDVVPTDLLLWLVLTVTPRFAGQASGVPLSLFGVVRYLLGARACLCERNGTLLRYVLKFGGCFEQEREIPYNTHSSRRPEVGVESL